MMLRPAQTWEDMRAQFHWGLPPVLNMAVQACDAWAAQAPGQVALIDATGGVRPRTFAISFSRSKLAHLI